GRTRGAGGSYGRGPGRRGPAYDRRDGHGAGYHAGPDRRQGRAGNGPAARGDRHCGARAATLRGPRPGETYRSPGGEIMSPETRVERLEARLRVTMHSRGVYTLAHWLSWHETGEPAPPAELAAVMTA